MARKQPAATPPDPSLDRRTLLGAAFAALGGLAAPAAATAAVEPSAAAGPHGPVVTPDPIKARIRKSGLAVELVDFSAPPRTSGSRPFARLNFLYHAGDGSGRIFANDSNGVLWLIDRDTGEARSFLDLRQARAGAFLPGTLQMGLRSFAFHPDFAKPGMAGTGKLYTASTETVASRRPGVRLFDGPYTTIHDGVIAEWAVDPAAPSRVDPASRRELFRVSQYKHDHQLDQLMFNPNNLPGHGGYGKLLITSGDGGNVPPHPDPFNLAQDTGSAHGKLLRIDPLRQEGGDAYGVPADNPFVGRAGHLPEIWALGLRHPLNLSVDRGGTGAVVMTDIGQAEAEEVNLVVKGANYGWPFREGTFVTDRTREDVLYTLPPDDAANGFTYPVAQYGHGEGSLRLGKAAIVGGYVYRGTAVPALAGHYLFGDMVVGRVFHVPVEELVPGKRAVIHELTLLRRGTPTTLLALVKGTSGRVDLRFGQDEDGEMYVLTKQDGLVRRLVAA